jgi:hypothetical protein
MEGELVIVSIISMAGMILVTQLWQMNWFKRENFKIQKKNIMDENKIKLDQLKKEMGLPSRRKKALGPELDLDSSNIFIKLLPLIKKLDGEQISSLVERFMPESLEDTGGTGGPLDLVLNYAEEHPDVVKSFLDGIGSKTQAEEQTPAQNENLLFKP